MKCSASLWLAISSAGNQDVRANFMNERYINWYTPWLSRDFEMLIFGEKRGVSLIIFPTAFARYYENKDFGLVGSIAWYIDNGKVTVYCPDAIDLESFYNKSIHPADRMRTHSACENATCRRIICRSDDALLFRRRERSRGIPQRYRRLLHGIPRLRFAPLGMAAS